MGTMGRWMEDASECFLRLLNEVRSSGMPSWEWTIPTMAADQVWDAVRHLIDPGDAALMQ